MMINKASLIIRIIKLAQSGAKDAYRSKKILNIE